MIWSLWWSLCSCLSRLRLRDACSIAICHHGAILIQHAQQKRGTTKSCISMQKNPALQSNVSGEGWGRVVTMVRRKLDCYISSLSLKEEMNKQLNIAHITITHTYIGQLYFNFREGSQESFQNLCSTPLSVTNRSHISLSWWTIKKERKRIYQLYEILLRDIRGFEECRDHAVKVLSYIIFFTFP